MQEQFKVKYENIKDWDSLKRLTWDNIEPRTDVMYYGRFDEEIVFGKVRFKHNNVSTCAIDWECNVTTTGFDSSYTFIKPLFILEGKAVYKGDVLWNSSEGCTDLMYIVSRIDDDDVLYSEHNHTGACCELINNLTWNKPQETKETLQDNPKFEVGDKVKYWSDAVDIGVVLEVGTNDVLVEWRNDGKSWHETGFLTKVQEDDDSDEPIAKNSTNLEIKYQVPDDLIKALGNMHNSLGCLLDVLEKYKK